METRPWALPTKASRLTNTWQRDPATEGEAVPTPDVDPTGAKILDGAVRVLADFGSKRATVESVAKYAGVSHMTIYRRWPTKNDLLKAAALGELEGLLEAAFGEPDDPAAPFADQAADAFTDVVWALQQNPLVLRELSESGEPSPLLSGTAVMETSLPMVADRLRRLAARTAGAPRDVEPVADIFVRLAHSLVLVPRADQPLTTRAQVAAYTEECFGPFLQGLSGQPDAAPVIELAQRRGSHGRPHLQIAAAGLVGILTLGAGLTAVLNGDIKVPFIAPAAIIESTTAPSPSASTGSPAVPVTGLQPGYGTPPVAVTDDQPPAVVVPSATAQPPVSPASIPQIGPRSADPAGSVGGGNPGADTPAPGNRLPALAPPPQPAPDPQPAPAPKPPGPGPQPPDPKPPAPPPSPGPKPPAPGPAPKPPAPAPKPPAPKPPPGPGPQDNRQAGPPN